MHKIDTLFLDIGGVLLTNGWDHNSRKRAAQKFGIDWEDFEERHKKLYPLHETDKITLDDYLLEIIFWKKRSFTLEELKEFIFSESQPYPEMLRLFKDLKKQYRLRIAAISNEGRDLATYRIKKFDLTSFIDDFFISCFVRAQKPDPYIYQVALDVTQVPTDRILYIDDRPNLIEAASNMMVNGFVHTSYERTAQKLRAIFQQ